MPLSPSTYPNSPGALPAFHAEPLRPSRFFQLAAVNILSNLTVPVSGLVGAAFLGHLDAIYPLAGVTLSSVLFNYLYRTLGFLRMSTTGVTAQAVGRNDRDTILLTGLRNSIVAIGLGLMLLVFQQPIREWGFSLLRAAPEIKAAGQAYYNARIWAAPATLLNFVLIGWLLGREQSGRVLLISAIGNGMNVLLDYSLIVRWGWGSAGAGWAVGLSQYLMALLGVGLICRELRWTEVQAILPQLWDGAALRKTLKLNGDIFIRTLAFLSTFSIFTSLSAAMSDLLLAENALLLQVFTLAVYLIDGLAFATESLTGVLYGQKAKKPLLLLLGLAGSSSFLLGMTFAGLFTLFPLPLFALLTNHTEILVNIGQSALWLLPILGFGSIAFMLDGYFLGLAEGVTLRNTALLATLFGFAPIAIWAWQQKSSDLLWLALAVFMAARALLLGIQVPRTLRPDAD